MKQSPAGHQFVVPNQHNWPPSGTYKPPTNQHPYHPNNPISTGYIPVHQCKPGMTPIDGWIICKGCGKNLTKLGS